MANNKVIHVELIDPYKGQKHWYFGSISAIYQEIPEEVIGLKLESLWTHLRGSEYVGKKCTIRKGVLHRLKTNRGRYGRSEK